MYNIYEQGTGEVECYILSELQRRGNCYLRDLLPSKKAGTQPLAPSSALYRGHGGWCEKGKATLYYHRPARSTRERER